MQRVPLTGATLAGIRFFRNVGDDIRDAATEHCIAHRFDEGERVLEKSDESRDVLFIVSGRVKVVVYSPEGDRTILRDQFPGEMLGELSALDGRPRSAEVEAVEDSLIVSMPADEFKALLSRSTVLMEEALLRLVALVRALSDRVTENDWYDVERRVRLWLFKEVEHYESGEDGIVVFDPAPTAEDIADRVGTHREGVSRVLSGLARQGITKRAGRTLHVLEVSALLDFDRETAPRRKRR